MRLDACLELVRVTRNAFDPFETLRSVNIAAPIAAELRQENKTKSLADPVRSVPQARQNDTCLPGLVD